jgi:hypothetical protein
MYEAEFVYSFNSKRDLSHVEAGNVLSENLVLDEHCHQVATGQELHEHVEEGGVLEGGVQLDDPRAVRLGEDITF